MNQPDFENLTRLVKLMGGKFIIVEDGKPVAVLMGYDEFENLASPSIEGNLLEKIERINDKITDAQLRDLREEVVTEWPPSPPSLNSVELAEGFDQDGPREEPIKIEPLDLF